MPTRYTKSWDTRTAPNGAMTLTAEARDSSGAILARADQHVTVNNPSVPTRYTKSWDSTSVPNGTVTLTAEARDNTSTGAGIVWQTGHETADFSEWEAHQAGESQFNNGTGSIGVISTDRAKSGLYSLKQTITTPGSGSGVGTRQFRWRTASGADLPATAFYSGWFFIPEHVVVNQGWWNIFQWKSKITQSDPVWTLDPYNPSTGVLRFRLWYHGQHFGETQQVFLQTINPTNIPIGQWVHIEAEYTRGITDGSVRVWQNGTLIYDMANVRTIETVDAQLQWSVNHYSADLTPATSNIYWDNLVIATARQGTGTYSMGTVLASADRDVVVNNPPIQSGTPVPQGVSHTLILRDSRSLAQLARITRWQNLSWTRRAVELGEFSLSVHHEHIEREHIDADRLLEIQRNGRIEFAGLLQAPRFDALTGWWEIAGHDLKQVLSWRDCWPASGQEYDSVADVAAETALRHYVANNLSAPGSAARNINSELSGITVALEPDKARGTTLSYNARYANLLTVCSQLARGGEIWFDIGIQPNYAGYVLQVSSWTDRTATSLDPFVFSVPRGTVSLLTYQLDRRNYRNVLSVLGQGEGATRTVVNVEDAVDIAAHYRREGALDSRNNATTAALTADGRAKLAEQFGRLEQLEMQPHPIRAPYRDAWNLGDLVTVHLPERNLTVDKRITEVQVTVDERGETVTVTLGDPPATLPRMLAAALTEVNRVQRA